MTKRSSYLFIIVLITFCFPYSFANSQLTTLEIKKLKEYSVHNADIWFKDLARNVINHNPADNPETAEMDRLGSNNMRKTTGSRLTIARDDENQDITYIDDVMLRSALGTNYHAQNINGQDRDISILFSPLYYSRPYDAHKNKRRQSVYFFKKQYNRGRPRDVIDTGGNYKSNYLTIKGDSFPSGHTWDGFERASLYALLFPERGREIYSRALKYGESRTIVGAHFPTDTIASRAGVYYYLSNILANDEVAKLITKSAKSIRSNLKNDCLGKQDLHRCLLNKPDPIASYYRNNNNSIGYYGMQRMHTSGNVGMGDIPAIAANLLRFRFPYLTPKQRVTILAETAYPKNSLAADAINDNWGLINLPEAYNGPKNFDYDWQVNQDVSPDLDIANFGKYDIWNHDISGKGKLLKNGQGTLELSGNNKFSGLSVFLGNVILSANNKFSDISYIYGGQLIIPDTGVLRSPLVVKGGVLTGSGFAEDVRVASQGSVSPGDAIGILHVGNITFEPNSQYYVDIDSNGKSDQIIADNTIKITGGTLLLQNPMTKKRLTDEEFKSLIGKSFIIMKAKNEIIGKFDSVQSGYLFWGEQVISQDKKQLEYRLVRNSTPLSKIAENKNELSITQILDTHTTSTNQAKTLKDALLGSKSLTEAKALLRNSIGQVYAENKQSRIASNQAVGYNMNTAANHQGALWINNILGYDHISSHNGLTGFNSRNIGIIGGVTLLSGNPAHFGISAGYSNRKLDSEWGTVNGQNYYMGLYGGLAIMPITIKGTYIHGIQHDNVIRHFHSPKEHSTSTTDYIGIVVDSPKIFYTNVFVDFDYLLDHQNEMQEHHQSIHTLTLNNNSTHHLYTTIGLKGSYSIPFDIASINVQGEIGWQHHLTKQYESNMKLDNIPEFFAQYSAGDAPNSLLISIEANMALSSVHKVGINYRGKVGKNNGYNSLQLNYQYLF